MLFQLSCCSSDSETLPACFLDWTSFVTAEQMKPGKLELVSAPWQSKGGITFPHPGAVLVKTSFSLHHNPLYLQVNLSLSSLPHNETGSLPFPCLSNLHLNFLPLSLLSHPWSAAVHHLSCLQLLLTPQMCSCLLRFLWYWKSDSYK